MFSSNCCTKIAVLVQIVYLLFKRTQTIRSNHLHFYFHFSSVIKIQETKMCKKVKSSIESRKGKSFTCFYQCDTTMRAYVFSVFFHTLSLYSLFFFFVLLLLSPCLSVCLFSYINISFSISMCL